MDNKDIVITIHGREYRIKSFKDPEYTRKLASYCDDIMKNIGDATKSTDYLKLLVLSLLTVTHNYFEAFETTAPSSREMDEMVANIIQSIEKTEKEYKSISAS